MTRTCPDVIASEQDVRDFFAYLYDVQKVYFHPDDLFEDYINLSTRQPTFTAEQCQQYNRLMEQAHVAVGDRIYAIGITIGKELGVFPHDD